MHVCVFARACVSSVIHGGKVYILDLAAKLDVTAEYICKSTWGEVNFPPPFGRDAYPEVKLKFKNILSTLRVRLFIFHENR